jgi:WD40 repeat protein
VWDRGSGTSVLELGHEALSPPQFLRDGRAVLLARGSTASIVQVGTRQPAGAEMGGGGKILVARASHDGSRIATLSDTGVLALWDANGGPVGRYDVPIGTDQNRPIFLDFSRDARLLAVPGAVTDAAKSASGFVRVWDLSKTGSAPREFAVPVPLVFAAFSPDAKWLLAFGTTDTAYVFAVDDSDGAGPSLLQHDATIVSAAFTVNGTSPAIVTASTDQTAKMWKQPWRAWTPFVLKHNASVNATALSPDDDRVITASTDGYARVWDAETAELLAKFRHTSSVAAARFSPDGDHVVTVAADGRARVWDLPAGAPSDVKDLAALAEAVAGYRVDGNGQLVRIEDPVQELSAERQAAARLQNSSTLAAHVVRWFLADRWERTTSPFSGTTITRFIQDRLATEADDSRREVLRLYPGHPALREE